MENPEKLLDDSSAITTSSIPSMKVSDLRRELKLRGLPTTGNKPELTERLQNALSKGFESLESPDEVNEDEVLGDVNILSGDDTKVQEMSEDEILGPANGKDLATSLQLLSSKPKPVTTLSAKPTATPVRKLSGTKPNDDVVVKEEEPRLAVEAAKENKNNITTIRTMTTDERLALRAKKFNQPPSAESRLKARSERFGIVNKAGITTKDKLAVTKTGGDLDKLKLRAQRFGQTVSTGLKMVEDKEKLLKRKQRFETVSKGTTSLPSTSTDDDKKKQRAERFAMS